MSDPENLSSEYTREPDPVPKYPKAMRIQRLAAVAIDYLVIVIVLSPLSMQMELVNYFEPGNQIPATVAIQIYVCFFLAFVVLNGWWLYRYGQTIGKRVLKIAIATENFQVPEFNRIVLLRHLPFFITWMLPGLNLINLLDWLMIFREDRRCLHDVVAGTQVIDVSQAG